MTFSLDRGTGGQPQLRASLTLDRATGGELKWEPFEMQSRGRRLRTILRFAHTGEVLGVAGQTIAGLVSLGALVLAWTGIALSLRRLSAWQKRRIADARPSADRARSGEYAASTASSNAAYRPSASERVTPTDAWTSAR